MGIINTSNLFIGNMSKSFLYILAAFVLLAAGCFWSDGSFANLNRYVQDHPDDFSKTASNADLRVIARYVPADLMAYRNYDPGVNECLAFSEFKQVYEGMCYFELTLDAGTEGKSIQQKIREMPDADRVNTYYGYQLNQDVRLIVGVDTVACALLHQVHDGGIQDRLLFTCAFQKSIPNETKHLIFLCRDRVFSGETFSLVFDNQALAQAPEIKR